MRDEEVIACSTHQNIETVMTQPSVTDLELFNSSGIEKSMNASPFFCLV
jgi:hypothetical protein